MPTLPACHYCGSRDGLTRCAWPDIVPVKASIADAQPGDVWISEQKRLRGEIVEIAHAKENPDLRIVWVKLPGHKFPYPYNRYLTEAYTSEGPGQCGQLACPEHSREVGPDRNYCRDHWKTWEAVA
jgi:hypothetical protein